MLAKTLQITYICLSIAAFLGFTIAIAVTRSPWWDEGMLMDPAYNLAKHHYLGSKLLSATGHPVVRYFEQYDRYTYWTVPGYLVVLAGWLKVTGYSLLSARLFSVISGMLLIAAGGAILLALTGSRKSALLAILIMATDYTIILSCVTVRMDVLAAALGYGGIALYLVLRQRDLNNAILLGALCTAAAALTHPVGVLHSGGLLLTSLIMDSSRLKPKHLLFASLPYCVLIALWGLYIAQAPSVFLSQLRAHSAYRIAGVSSPIMAIVGDFKHRYVHYFYIPNDAIASFKIVILISYVVAVITAVAIPSLRALTTIRYLALLALLYYCGLAVIDAQRFPNYFVHIIPVFALILAAVLEHLRTIFRVPTAAIAAVLTLLVSVQVAGHLIKIRANAYKNEYEPTIQFLRENASEDTVIMGGSHLWFGLGDDYRLIDDARFGCLSGVSPDIIVLDAFHRGPSQFTRREPDVAQCLATLLHRFQLAAHHGEFRIFLPLRGAE